MKKLLNWKLALILIILLAAFLRLWQLGSVPSGIPDDEAAYIYNAYSIWHTGKDILGKFIPLSFNAHSSMSPVPIYLTAPFVGLMGINPLSGRLPAALMSLGSVIILFFIVDKLFGNKRIALFSSLLFAISPWALQIGRGALLDVDFACFFLLSGIYIFIVNIHTKKFLWSIVPFLLAFYSYHATKIFFVFLIPLLIFFYRKELLKKKRETILFLLGVVLIVFSFIIAMKTQGVTRQTEVSVFDGLNASTKVNLERTKNNAPWALRVIFSNKPLYFLRIIRENYLNAFSFEYLFLSGGSEEISNIYYRGELYIIELPLLLFGIYALLKDKDKFRRNLVLALFVISPLPSTFTINESFVNRDIMLLPIILIIIACGFEFLFDLIRKYSRLYKRIFWSVFVIFYLFLFFGYLYQYYYRWTVYGAETWNRSYKDLVALIASQQNNYTRIYVSRRPNELLLQYAIYEKTDPTLIQKVWGENPIKLYNITMFPNCLNKNILKTLPDNTLYAALAGDCYFKNMPSAKIVDYGEPLHVIWNVYEKQ